MASPSKSAIDPVCGMDVETTEQANRSAYRGHDYFFCSAGCKHQFDDNPDRFAPKT